MATHQILKAKGLNVSDNQLELPPGSMARANNVVTPFRDVLESRRGQEFMAYTFGGGTHRSYEGVFFQDALIIQYHLDKLARDTGVGFSVYSGSYFPPDAELLRMKFIEAALNLYFTTSTGVYVLDLASSAPVLAGIPRPVSMTGYPDSAAGDWLTASNSVGYRAVIGKTDANNNLKLSAPSERTIVNNNILVSIGGIVRTAPDGPHPAGKVTVTATSPVQLRTGDIVTLAPGEGDFAAGNKTVVLCIGGGSLEFTYDEAGANVASTVAQAFTIDRGTQMTVYLPAGLTTDHFLRVYRTENYELSDLEADPGEEHFQVYEAKLTALNITQGFVSFADLAPESMLGGELYTNPNSGDGLGSGNERPPIAKDVCEYDGRVWYFNTTDKHRLFLQIIGIGSPAGLQASDTVTIAGRTYTFGTSSGGMEGVLLGTGTPGHAVEATARELCVKINANTNNTLVYAYYVSAGEDAPGRILIEERTVGGVAFTAYASRITAWAPALTTGSSGAVASKNDRRPHGASYSKAGQPEAVPLTNWEPVGAANHQILRGIPLRDKIFVFTEGGRIYTISGTGGRYRVDALDGTAELVGPDTAVEHANQIYALTTQGVCAISDAGVKILSTGIESELLELFGSPLSNVKTRAFGVSYESDRQYQLWLPSDNDDGTCTQAFVYNSLYGTWTRWTGERTWGRVNKLDGLLYMGEGSTNKIRRERKSYTRQDFADEAVAMVITASSARSVTVTLPALVSVGDMLYQSDDVKALVTAVNTGTGVVTVLSTETWANGAVTVYVAIDNSVKWAPAVPNGASIVKQFRDLTLHFKSFFVNSFLVVFDSDQNSTETTREISSPGFGLTAFGSGLFGQEIGAKNRRVDVPQNNQVSTQVRVGFDVREAWGIWTIHGYSLEYEALSEKNGR